MVGGIPRIYCPPNCPVKEMLMRYCQNRQHWLSVRPAVALHSGDESPTHVTARSIALNVRRLGAVRELRRASLLATHSKDKRRCEDGPWI
jgi:hypothetical protein